MQLGYQTDRKSIKKLLKDINKAEIEPLYITRKASNTNEPKPTSNKIVLKNEKEKKTS